MFFHFPVGAFSAVEDAVRVVDVFFQAAGDAPLGVVRLGGRCGDVATREDFLRVAEDCLAPPFELFVFCWGEAADERTWGFGVG